MKKYAVAYYTRSGNTKKMAETVGRVLGVTPTDISEGLSEDVQTLFLGCSPYAFKLVPEVEKFIIENAEKIGRIVCFGSCASGHSVAKKVRKVARENGIRFYKQSFKCFGSFGIMHKNHPDVMDLAALKDFTESVVRDLNRHGAKKS